MNFTRPEVIPEVSYKINRFLQSKGFSPHHRLLFCLNSPLGYYCLAHHTKPEVIIFKISKPEVTHVSQPTTY